LLSVSLEERGHPAAVDRGRPYLRWWDLRGQTGGKSGMKRLAIFLIKARQKTIGDFNEIQSRFDVFDGHAH
jgi:hypothetical protein